MADDVNKPRTASTWRRAAAALVGTAALGAVNAAEAHDWKRHRHHDAPIGYVVVPPGHVRYAAPAVVYAVPAPIVVYPQPVAYVPLPYAPAYPAYGPPVGSLSFGLTVPLR